jgi:hypothetical protein
MLSRFVRRLRAAVPALALLALLAGPAAGQVGHDPARSPYRDLRYGQFLSATAGYMSGSGGRLGIGPHQGRVFGLRHDFLADRPLSISLGGGWASLERNYADTAALVNRIKGPVSNDVYYGELVAQLNVAGGRTWRNLAPYVNLGLGLAFAGKVPEDSTGYKFGTRFYVAPGAGVRVFVSRRLFVRLEARAMFWNLSYPAHYRTKDPDGFGPVLPLLAGLPLKEWSPVPMLHAGLGYAFHRPFF